MKRLARKVSEQQKLRYLITGGSSFVLEFLVFTLLFAVSHNIFVGNTISFICGLLISFWLHKIWSFKGDHGLQTHHQLVRYTMLALTNLLLTNVVIGVLHDHFLLQAQLAKVLTMVCMVAWNYGIMNKLIFHERRDPEL